MNRPGVPRSPGPADEVDVMADQEPAAAHHRLLAQALSGLPEVLRVIGEERLMK
jgi:hypothetical protein